MSYDSIFSPIRKRRKSSNKSSPPRPQNAWLLFRRDFECRVRSQRPNELHTLNKISKTAAESWKIQPEKVKQYFNVLSKLASYKHKAMYPEYVYNPKKFKNGENFIFKHINKDKIVKSRNSKASLFNKAKASSSNTVDYSSVISNEDCPKNDEQSILQNPSPIIDIPEVFMFFPNFIHTSPSFPQCQFYYNLNNNDITDNEQIGYMDYEFGDIIYVCDETGWQI
ncbi:4090_t:CDS:1 [Paraglomus occultum]|uniref:4090_t:CDS:1 n=1 Tax=Paraglomus occultum TaxID=144539 RepID=A0A9N9FBH5_9GLOM|nr:4090_t:CDS:1 [Paraglomus occultum]